MTEFSPTSDKLKEPLEEWVSGEVKRRWDLQRGSDYDSEEFPQRITPLILDLVSNQSEAETAINILFEKLYTREIETKLDCYHSHAIALETESWLSTDHALSLAQNTEEFYQELCNRRRPEVKTTGRVISKLFGPEIGSQMEEALDSVPTKVWMTEEQCLTGWRESLQRESIRIIRNCEMERFIELCSETAKKINAGEYQVELSDTWDHHGTYAGGVYTLYHRENLEEATVYLRENGIDVRGTNSLYP